MPTPPASWENATPVFGIRYPKPTAPAKNLPDAFNHIGTDLENALIADQATPPGLAYQTGTQAQRLAATPAQNLVWIETDTAGNPRYIGTGTAWLFLGTNSPIAVESRRFNLYRAAVPTGTFLYDMTLDAEVPAERTPTYPVITYAAADFSWTLTTPGWYSIFFSMYIDWGYAGAGARAQINDTNKSGLPVAAGYPSTSNAQVASCSYDGCYSDGTKKIWFQGLHNNGATQNLRGWATFIKLRGTT